MNPQQIFQLQKRVELLEKVIAQLVKSDRYIIQRDMQFQDGRHIIVGKGSGLTIGTETTQKIGFYNVTPVIQGTAISAPSNAGATYSQTDATTWVNSINSIITRLKNIGITA